MPLGFNFNLTLGLKSQVSGIKIVTLYKQSIFQVEWLIATLIWALVSCAASGEMNVKLQGKTLNEKKKNEQKHSQKRLFGGRLIFHCSLLTLSKKE